MAIPAKILVVDDDASVRDVFTDMLNTRGFQVVTAEDGLSGLKTAEAELPDLIITDIDMPNMNGIQLVVSLRQRSDFAEVPILVVSGSGMGKVTSVLKVGANQAMSKPVDFDFFIGLITQLCPSH